MQRVEAQFALYQNGILDAEVWQLRKTYIKGMLVYPIFAEIWSLEVKNAMFTKAFITEINSTQDKKLAGFMGAEHIELETYPTVTSKTK